MNYDDFDEVMDDIKESIINEKLEQTRNIWEYIDIIYSK